MLSVPTMSANRDGWILSMVTIGVGSTAAYPISKPTLISMSGLCLVADRHDIDVDVHADKRVGRAEIGAVQRHGLARIARHRHPDQVAGADDAVGRIELDPARARQIGLHPGVGRAA